MVPVKATRLLILLFCVAVFGVVVWRLFGARTSPPNLMLIVLDTTRADHLGAYGYERQTSPVLDSLAKEHWLFRYAVSAAPWTPPSVATLFTGLYPVAHGVMPPNSRELAREASHRLHEQHLTIAELLQQHGYQTSGITPNPWTKEEFGYHQGFERYQFLNREVAGRISKEGVAEIDRMAKVNRPFFLYLHYLDPHDPYTPPEKYDRFSGPVSYREHDPRTLKFVNAYDGEILYMDAAIGSLLEHLKKRGLYDNTHIVIVGDHGEQFKERGHLGHGFQLHNEEIHVPLIVKAPGGGRTIDYTVSTVDVFPTLVELAGVPMPAFVQGGSLLNDKAARGRIGVLSEIQRIYRQKALVTLDGKKLIIDYGKPDDATAETTAGVFDRHRDYRERAPLDDRDELKQLFADFEELFTGLSRERRTPDEGATTPISEETLDQLKSLGYL